jgi:hypothetical protein
MESAFCTLPQTRCWHEVREHLSLIPGVTIKNSADAPVVASWIDFTFRGNSFSINADDGKFLFFAKDGGRPESVLDQVRAHFETF